MTKLFTANKYLPAAFALAALATAGTAPAFAQSAGAWSAGISARNGNAYVHTPSTNNNGYGSYAQAPATIPDAAQGFGLEAPDRFGISSQR
jgi:hypothetical protein